MITTPRLRRQQFLLSLAAHLKRGLSDPELQSKAFSQSLQMEDPWYEFTIIDEKPHSFQLEADKSALISRYADINCDHHQLSLFEVPSPVSTQMEYDSVVADSIPVETTEHVAEGISEEWAKIAPEPCSRSEALFTAGYEGRSVDGFMNQLMHQGIRILIDVRKNPISRKYGFSKRSMIEISNKIGIDYLHLPELGIESEARKGLSTQEDYERLFAQYEEHLPLHQKPLEEVLRAYEETGAVLLMCFEKDPGMCHRSRIANYLSARFQVCLGGNI